MLNIFSVHTFFRESDCSFIAPELVLNSAEELSHVMAADIPDEEDTLEEVTVNGVEDAEVGVVWPDDGPLVTPGHSGGETITPWSPGFTRD